MIVCIYTHSLVPGGAERQVVVLAKGLSRAGLDVHVICNNLDGQNGHYLGLLKETEVKCHALNIKDLAAGAAFAQKHPLQYPRMPGLSFFRVVFFCLLGKLSVIAPDILHCYLDMPNCIGGYTGFHAGVPGILLSGRNMNPESVGQYSPRMLPIYKFLRAHANMRLEANSRQGAQSYAGWLGIPSTEIIINPNGIDPDIYAVPDPVRRECARHLLDIGGSCPVVLYLSRNVDQKRPSDMLDVAAQLRGRIPDVLFLAAGRGFEPAGELEPAVRERGLSDTVRLLGVRTDIPALLAAADVLLLTSRVEGFPNAIMEAMSTGLPVVATGVGGVPELVRHGEEGFLHPVGDIQGLADSLALLLGAPALRREMGEKARDRIVSNFTVDKLVERTINQYAALLKQAPGYA